MIDRVIFDVEFFDAQDFTKPAGSDEGCKTGIQAGLGFPVDRKEFEITPKVSIARGDFFTAYGSLNGVVIIDDFQRAEAGVAYVKRLLRIFLSALSALESVDKAHGPSFSAACDNYRCLQFI